MTIFPGLNHDGTCHVKTKTYYLLVDHHYQLLVASGGAPELDAEHAARYSFQSGREGGASFEVVVDAVGDVEQTIAHVGDTDRLCAVGIDAGSRIVVGDDGGSQGRVIEHGIFVGSVGIIDVHLAEVCS